MGKLPKRKRADNRDFSVGNDGVASIAVKRKPIVVSVSGEHVTHEELYFCDRASASALSEIQEKEWAYGGSIVSELEWRETIPYLFALRRARFSSGLPEGHQRRLKERLSHILGGYVKDGKPFTVDVLYDPLGYENDNHVSYLPWERFLATTPPVLFSVARSIRDSCLLSPLAFAKTDRIIKEAEAVEAVVRLIEHCNIEVSSKSTLTDKEYCRMVHSASSRFKKCRLTEQVAAQLKECGINTDVAASVLSCGINIDSVSKKIDDTCITLESQGAIFTLCAASVPNASTIKKECQSLISSISKESFRA